jgi:type I restriction enzyme S subunit
MGAFLKPRQEFFTINDLERYKRITTKLHAGGVVLRDEVFGSQIKTKKQQAVKAGDLVVAEIDAKVGGVGIVPADLEGAIVSSHYFLYEIDESVCDPTYLEYYIRKGAAEEQFQEFVRGSTNYAAIRAYHALQLQIPLPPLPEQRRIVARIEELAARIDEALNLKQAARMDSANLWKMLSNIARDTPHPLRELGEIADFLDGQRIPLSKSEREGRQGSYPYYGASGIIDYVDDFIFDEDLILLSEDGANLINRSKPIAFIARGRYWVNNHAHVLRPKPDVADLRFLKYALSDYDVSIYNFASAQAKLNQRNAAQISFPLPPLPEQHRIVAHLDALQAQVDELTALQDATQAGLDALLPSVLDRAFRGEL